MYEGEGGGGGPACLPALRSRSTSVVVERESGRGAGQVRAVSNQVERCRGLGRCPSGDDSSSPRLVFVGFFLHYMLGGAKKKKKKKKKKCRCHLEVRLPAELLGRHARGERGELSTKPTRSSLLSAPRSCPLSVRSALLRSAPLGGVYVLSSSSSWLEGWKGRAVSGCRRSADCAPVSDDQEVPVPVMMVVDVSMRMRRIPHTARLLHAR
jgi:hypothetical protein